MSETAPVAPAAAPPACSLGSITEWLTLNNSFYTNFEQYTVRSRGGDSGDVAQLKSQLPSTCSGCSKIIDDVGKIDHAYDYACRQNSPNGQSSSIGDSAPCRLFYYWFGHTYWSDLKNHALSKVVDKIYQTLGNSFSSERMKCEFKYEDDIDQTIFGHMKIIFEYYNDYKQLQGKLTTTSSTCAKEWSTYWTTLSTACKAMENICTEEGTSDHSSKQYCTDFNNTYAVHCNTANLHQEMEELITQTLPEAVRSATTTSSLSSIFGTLATIGAPFLLYKYKPWSSWFGNHTSGNGGGSTRKKRTIGRNFGSSIEDTLTEYSRETSTIGDATIDGTVSSAAHARPSTGGRTNNTRGRGMVGYQNM